MGRKIKLSHTEVDVKLFLEALAVFGILALVLVGVYYLEPAITGFVTVTKQLNYTDEVNLEFSESGEYLWELTNPGDLRNIKISGRMIEDKEARVYIEDEGARYLIFDSSQLVGSPSGIFGITGFAVLDEMGVEIKTEIEGTLNDEQQELFDLLVLDISKTRNNVEIEIKTDEGQVIKKIIGSTTESQNELINDLSLNLEGSIENIKIRIESEFKEEPINDTTEKIININLEYGDNAVYDANNDGVETLNGVIDFSVDDSDFNWEVDEGKLCTRYEIYSVENEDSGFACFGDEDCCNFVGLESSRELWNENLFLSYGGYGSAFDNIVFSQILYVDYDLTADEPYSDVAYSSWDNLTAKFLEGVIEFEDVCIDTCVFSGNLSSYKLVIEMEDGKLWIDEIKYSIEEKLINNYPLLIKDIENISVIENKNYTLNLEEYFSDEDGDELVYGYSEMDNITIRFEDNLAYIIPDKGFTGAVFAFITASDSFGEAISNLFAVEVKKEEKLGIELLDSVIIRGDWTVGFRTTGTGNLTISAINGATYSEMHDDNASTVNNLGILELRCGDYEIFDKDDLIETGDLWFVLMDDSRVKLIDLMEESILVKGLYIENYNCDDIGYYVTRVLTKGESVLEFDFSSKVQIAGIDYLEDILREVFEIKGNEGNTLAVFDSFGNADIKGNLMQNALVDADGDDFDYIITNFLVYSQEERKKQELH